MGDAMEEDPPHAGEGRRTHNTRAETATSTTDVSLVRRRKKLLDTISLTFHFDFNALPTEAQDAYWQFQENRGYTRFAVDLRQLLLKNSMNKFLRQCPAFLLAITELFDEKHPELGLRALCEEQQLAPDHESGLEARPNAFGARYLPRVHAEEDDDSESSLPLARIARLDSQRRGSATTTATMRPGDHGTLRLIAGPAPAPGAEAAPTQAPEPEPKAVIPGFVISTKRTPPASGSGSSRQGMAPPDQDTRETDNDGPSRPPRNVRYPQQYDEAWLRDFTGDRGAPPPDFNLYPYKGWKIESPQVMLARAKNFLADEDVNRTIEWDRKFAELAEYFSYLLYNWKGERWGADLHEVIDMLHTHRLFEDYHYGKPKLNLNFPTAWSLNSSRLPRVPGRGVVLEDEGEDMGERKLLFNPIRAAHDAHYEMPSEVLKKYVDEYGHDARYFWSSSAGVEPRPERLSDADPANRRFNMVECENNAYEKSMLKNMQETCLQLESQPGPPSKQKPQDEPDINSLRQFASFRGTRRAALQQCLNQFRNIENTAVANQWRVLILPPPKKPAQPDAGVIFTTMQVADIPEKEARDPFSYTLAHKWHSKAVRYWSEWMRPHSIKEAYGERLWAQREEPVMDLPINFKAPYVIDYLDAEMRKTQALLERCYIIWEKIQDMEQHYSREFLAKVVKCVWEGLESGEGIYLEQGSVIRAGADTPVPHIRPLEEELLRFITEPSVNADMFGIKQGAETNEGREDRGSRTLGPHARLFEERVDEMLSDISHDSFFHPEAGPESQDFMTVLNRDCDGPMKRYRFSRAEAIKYALALKKKGKIYANKDLVVRRPYVEFHPEERIRWLDSDHDVGPAEAPAEPKDKDSVWKQGEDTISTDITEPESVDLGPYAVGLPKLANIRSWVSTILDRQSVSVDMEKTLTLFEGLGYRLGRTIRELRDKYAEALASLTQEQREENADFVETIVGYWEHDLPIRANEPKKNRHKVGNSYKNRVTPMYADVVKMAEPEAVSESWGGEEESDDAIHMIRKAIIREAYENKSMLFPTRVTRRIDDIGKTVTSAPRREPVWSFGHPERCGEGPRFWDMNRWPLHLQTDETRELIENSGNDRSVCVVPPSLRGKSSKRSKKKVKWTKRVQPDDIMESVEDEQGVAREPKGKEPLQLGEPVIITYADRAQSRRRYEPGTPEYWLGDTPLQKQRIEERLKGGLASTGPARSWRQRLSNLFGAPKEEDPTALPYVSPRDIPKSRPLPTVMEQVEPELPHVDPEDIPTSMPQRDQPDSPTDPGSDGDDEDEDEDPGSERHTPPPTASAVSAEAAQVASPSIADRRSTTPARRQRQTIQSGDSHRLRLEIVEPEEEESAASSMDEEDVALYRALHGDFYDY